jgi:hypothetical protein
MALSTVAQPVEQEPCFLRQTCLGSEAVYELLEDNGETVTVEVVRAPGLTAGTQLRLMAQVAQAMERLGPDADVRRIRRFVPPAFSGRDGLSDRVSAVIGRRGALRPN